MRRMADYAIVNLFDFDDETRGRFPGMEGVVVSGTGRVRLDDEVRDIRQWDVVRVAPPVVRAFEAGPEGLELIAIGGPKPEGGDGVRSDAPWPDEG